MGASVNEASLECCGGVEKHIRTLLLLFTEPEVILQSNQLGILGMVLFEQHIILLAL